MMTLLRKHRQWLMIVIAILALPFCLYFVKTDYSRMGHDTFATVYGRTVTNVEAQRNARLFGLAQALGMDTLAQGLGGGGNDANQATATFALNLIVLRHEAEALGIQPTQAELADFVRNLRGLRGPNGFDPHKYQEFAENVLPANGFTDAQIEELATDAISLNRIKDLVTVGLFVPESESKSNFEQAYGKLEVHAIRVQAGDFDKEVKVTDEDIQKYYETHKATLKTDEKRKIEFAKLSLTDEEKKLTGPERIEALKKLLDRADHFTQALAEKGAQFDQVAAKSQLPVKATGEFTATAPDPQLKDDPQLATTAFQLTTQEPNSDPIQTADGYYILHLSGITESRPLTLEEAKGKIVDAIKLSRTREMAMNKGRQVAEQLRESLQAKEPFSFALEKAKVKAEKIAPFNLMEAFNPTESDKAKEKDRPKDFLMIRNAAARVQPGEVSDFFPSEDGGLIVYVEKREPPDEAKYREEKAAFDERIMRNKRTIVFDEWLRDRQRDAGLASTTAPQPAGPPRGPQPAGPPPERKS